MPDDGILHPAGQVEAVCVKDMSAVGCLLLLSMTAAFSFRAITAIPIELDVGRAKQVQSSRSTSSAIPPRQQAATGT